MKHKPVHKDESKKIIPEDIVPLGEGFDGF